MTSEQVEQAIEQYDRDSILYEVARGMAGKNVGLNNGLGRADDFVHGIQQATGYLYGGESGTAKTTLTDYAHVLCPWFDAKQKKIDFKMVYFSWELAKVRKKVRFASALINTRYGLRLPVSYILSRGRNRISSEHWEIVQNIHPEIEEIFGDIEMHNEPCNSRRLVQILTVFAKKHGTFRTVTAVNEHGDKEEVIVGYTKNDPDAVYEVIIDHISYADEDPGYNLKVTIDRISKALVWFRNICGISYVIIQQFSSEMQSTDRRKLDKKDIAPMRIDFADSKYTYRDADIVWGLVCPAQFGLNEFKGYDSSRMRSLYIHAFLMKNRDGAGAVNYPLFMDPIGHTFEVLPKVDYDPQGRLPILYAKADYIISEREKTDFTDQIPKQIK